ncbi:MAG: hypothetical protein H7144_17140 [Burkholderiales bacterium]|nr:hypothetical protein [Phycisphaerae bacterium]
MRAKHGLILSVLISGIALAQATQPAADSADAAAVKDALTRYNAAVINGNVDELTKSIDVVNDLQKQAVAQMGELTSAGQSLYAATLKQFGQAKLDEEHVTKEVFPAGFPQLPVEHIQVKTSGDKAVLLGEDGSPMPLTMIKKDGTWKFDGSILQIADDKELQERRALIAAVVATIGDTSGDVTAGHFRSADEVVVLLQHRVSKRVQAEQMKRAPIIDGPATGPEMTPGPAVSPGPAAPPAPTMP